MTGSSPRRLCNNCLKYITNMRYKYCPWCGVKRPEIETVPSFTGHWYLVSELKILLQPVVDLNGYVWIAEKVGVNESRVRHVLNGQTYVSEKVVDEWLTKLGLTNAFHDGSLTLWNISSPPTKYYEE